jgi:hypothetical protein
LFAAQDEEKGAFVSVILNEGCQSEGSTRSDFGFINTLLKIQLRGGGDDRYAALAQDGALCETRTSWTPKPRLKSFMG